MIAIWIGYLYIVFLLLVCACQVSTPICNHNSSALKLVFGVFITLGTFAIFTGDYLGYQQLVADVVDGQSNAEMEPVYIWLIDIVAGNIHWFRFAIFLISFILLYYLLKKTDNLDFRILFIYALIELLTVIDGRQQISIYLFFIGCIFIWKNHRKYLGLLFIFVGLFTHKSAVFLLLAIPFIFIEFTKREKCLLYILFPVFISVILYVFNLLLSQPELNFLGSVYLKADEISFAPLLMTLLVMKPVLIMILSIWTLHTVKLEGAPLYIHYIYRWLWGMVYINSIIAFMPIENYIIIYERFLRPQVTAVLLILSYCIKPKLINNVFFFLLSFAIFIYMNVYIILQVFRSRI